MKGLVDMATCTPPAGLSDLGEQAKELYARLRPTVETKDNIGKLIVMDLVSGDYEIDDAGIETARRLRERHPDCSLFAIRIGYKATEALGGILERTTP
jgi:hypothetical protein